MNILTSFECCASIALRFEIDGGTPYQKMLYITYLKDSKIIKEYTKGFLSSIKIGVYEKFYDKGEVEESLFLNHRLLNFNEHPNEF